MSEMSDHDQSASRPLFRRGSVRALAPLSVIAVVAAGVAIVPAIASAAPSLPSISAQDLLVKVAQSKVESYSGTVSETANLGLPALPDLSGPGGGGAALNPLTLLTGTNTLQVAANGPQQLRIGLLGEMSEYNFIHDGTNVWIYDSHDNSVEHGTTTQSELRAGTGTPGTKPGTKPGTGPAPAPMTPQAAAKQILAAIGPTTKVTVDGTQSVAGQAAYTLVVEPKQAGSLISRVEIAVDAQNGAALRVALYATASSSPAFAIGFTSVSFATPSAAQFAFTPPKGATVTQLDGGTSTRNGVKPSDVGQSAPTVLGKSWLSVVEVHGVNLGELQSEISTGSGGSGSGLTVRANAPAGPNQSDLVAGPRTGAGNQNPTGLLNGDASSELNALLGAGREVSGAFGSGKLYTTNVLSVLITSDGRLFVGAVTPAVLESDAAAQGTK